MYRKEVATAIGGYQKMTAEDYDLFVRIAQICKTINLDEKLVMYRIHNESDSRVRSKAYDIAVEEIVNYQFSNLIKSQKLKYIPILIFTKNYKRIKKSDIYSFFKEIYRENESKDIYNQYLFYTVFNKIWLEIIFEIGNMQQSWNFILKCNFVGINLNFKQKRKLFKRILKPF